MTEQEQKKTAEKTVKISESLHNRLSHIAINEKTTIKSLIEKLCLMVLDHGKEPKKGE